MLGGCTSPHCRMAKNLMIVCTGLLAGNVSISGRVPLAILALKELLLLYPGQVGSGTL